MTLAGNFLRTRAYVKCWDFGPFPGPGGCATMTAMNERGVRSATRQDLKHAVVALRRDMATLRKEMHGGFLRLRKEDITAIHVELASLRAGQNRLAVGYVSLHSDMSHVRATMATKEDLGKMVAMIADFSARFDSYAKKTLTHPDIINSHEARINHHERRISTLESRATP